MALDATSEEFIQLLRDARDGAGQVALLNASVETATTKASEAEAARDAALIAESNAGGHETSAQLQAWIAEAKQMTADSYASEAEDVFVKEYTSDGDGTFTAVDTTKYSTLHYQTKILAQVSILMKSDITGITGASQVINTVIISQANYDAIATPEASTQYIIVG